MTDSFVSLCCAFMTSFSWGMIFGDHLNPIRFFRYGYIVIAYDYISWRVIKLFSQKFLYSGPLFTSVLEIYIFCNFNSKIRENPVECGMLPSRFFPPSFQKSGKFGFCNYKMPASLFYNSCFPENRMFYCGDVVVFRCESSHGSPSWVKNIIYPLLSLRAKRLSRILIMLFVLGSFVCSVLLRLGSLETLSSSFSWSL